MLDSADAYKVKILKNIDILKESLLHISFILEPEIKTLQANLEQKFYTKLEAIQQRNADFFESIKVHQKERFEAVQVQKEAFIAKWRLLKHDQSIKAFLVDIEKTEFTFPEERKLLYQTLKEKQTTIFENRQGLINQIVSVEVGHYCQATLDRF